VYRPSLDLCPAAFVGQHIFVQRRGALGHRRPGELALDALSRRAADLLAQLRGGQELAEPRRERLGVARWHQQPC
jgi:hypothetical protein